MEKRKSCSKCGRELTNSDRKKICLECLMELTVLWVGCDHFKHGLLTDDQIADHDAVGKLLKRAWS